MQPFRAAQGQTVNIAVSSTSQSVQVTNTSGLQQYRVFNGGTATVWVAHGTTAPTATLASSVPIGPGMAEVYSAQGPLFVAAIAAAASGNVYITPGEGF